MPHHLHHLSLECFWELGIWNKNKKGQRWVYNVAFVQNLPCVARPADTWDNRSQVALQSCKVQ
jgi:hypothetical protein